MALSSTRDPRPPRVAWADLLDTIVWRQGEHVSIVGPTGQGKTTLANALIPRMPYVVMVATKPRDSTLDKMTRRGADPRYVRVEEWPPSLPPQLARHILLWPRWRNDNDTARQREVLRHALNEIFGEGGWCVAIDEVYYLCSILGLERIMRVLWQQARSSHLSIVASTQRPAWVPLELYSQATHVFFFRSTDKRDLDRIGGLGTVDPAVIRETVRSLDRHEFVYVNTRDDTVLRSRVSRS